MAAITTQAVEHKLTGNPPLRDFRQEVPDIEIDIVSPYGVGSPPSDVAEYGIKCQQCAALIYDDRLHVPLKSGFVAVREGYSVKLKVFRFVRTHL